MERSIVHYNHGPLFQRRQELVREPEFKKSAVHRSVILKWRKNLTAHLSGDNAAALILSASDPPKHLLAPRCMSVFSIQIGIYTAFIYIGDLFLRYILDFFLICRCFLPILLLVADSLFSLLSYDAEGHHVCRSRCIQTLRPFLTGTHLDVLQHMPSAFPDRSFGNFCAALFYLNSLFLPVVSSIFVLWIWIP